MILPENTARMPVLDKVNRLLKVSERMQKLQTVADTLSEDVTLDIIDGWSTGDELLDFVLVACNGTYDPYVLSVQYRSLQDLGPRKPNQIVVVIQKSVAQYDEDGPLYLRNIHLATLRSEAVKFDVDSFSMLLPVAPHHLVWSEFYSSDGFIVGGYKTLDGPWLKTGPLHNEYCEFGHSSKNEDGIHYVPEDATCDIVLLPQTDPELLLRNHGIDSETMVYLRQIWIIEMSSQS